MRDYSNVDRYLETHLSQSLLELCKLVAQPSVGTQNLGLDDCAALVAAMLQARGFEARVMKTPGAPIVLGTHPGASS